MTTAQLEAMQAGRRKAQDRKARALECQRHIFVRWIKDEAMAHKRMIVIREFAGIDSSEYSEARSLWTAVLKQAPTMPPDSAWSS